jgi:hypothetical protein
MTGVIEYGTAEKIARACHEANRAYCMGLGDHSQKPWDEAEQWQRDSAISGVVFCLQNPEAAASRNHEEWLKEKLAKGWKFGPVKSPEKMEHPCMVPFDQLPADQKKKDFLFKAIVGALGDLP